MAYNNDKFKDSKNKKGVSFSTPAPSLREREGGEAVLLKDGWAADIAEAVRVMKQGGVILYPTDTVWGIGCDATNAEAVKRVYEIKKRDDSKALICLIDSDKRISRYIRQQSQRLLSLIMPADLPVTLWQRMEASLCVSQRRRSPRNSAIVCRSLSSLQVRI